jgi:hypothetical protein
MTCGPLSAIDRAVRALPVAAPEAVLSKMHQPSGCGVKEAITTPIMASS